MRKKVSNSQSIHDIKTYTIASAFLSLPTASETDIIICLEVTNKSQKKQCDIERVSSKESKKDKEKHIN